MKKNSPALVYWIAFFSFLGFISCKKINASTELGNNLIPSVDNIHTFETSLLAYTNNAPFNDSTKLIYSDQVAVGSLNDPDFGQTKADAYFTLSSSVYGTFPFLVNPAFTTDSLKIDSVVLSLAYSDSYGDTNSMQTFHVFEIARDPSWNDSLLYSFTHPDFPTTGSELGSASFIPANLKDTIHFSTTGKLSDSVKTVNLLRIKFNSTSLGSRFAQFDTTRTSMTGSFATDSLFRSFFRGLAIKSDNPSGNGSLCYFTLSDVNKTKLTFYIRATKNGVIDTTAVNFVHSANGQANIIKRTAGGNYASYLTNGPAPDDKIYLQSSPGSYVAIKIPGLDTMANKVIHRAEIIATRINSPADNIFTAPSRLLIDRINATHDTAFLLQNDISTTTGGEINYSSFGGTLAPDNTYHFNITRHVQGILTRHEPNDTLRMYAPLRSILYASNLKLYIAAPVLSHIANGRVVFAGGNYTDPSQRLRLRIIYSNL